MMIMTTRELWRHIMNYDAGQFDRMPVIHWKGWDETHERWEKEGMPSGVDPHVYFKAEPIWDGIGINLDLLPKFPLEILEETSEYELVRMGDGVVEKHIKGHSSVPHYVDFTFKTANEWPEYKKRLQPHPDRLPQDLDNQLARLDISTRPVNFWAGSMMGFIRNWMGVENMCYLLADDPDCFADYVNTMSDLVCWGMDQILPHMKVKPDIAHGWEDICGRCGPFVSPPLFEKYVAHGYRKIRAKLDQYGVKYYSVDSDGDITSLIRPWLESGVNVMFPIEPGTWGQTPERVRKQFGKEVRMIGGYNKLALEHGRDAIHAELESHIPLMKEGGLVLMPDHLITPGVSLEDYKYYLDLVRNLRF